ncbi:MAG: hypothetical protein K2L27_04165 [Muribaculaceae bacterium]|nr:hypothetical protein [Muribaculaceae bacterium]
MEINTQFAIGDKVWTVNRCKAVELTVDNISVCEREGVPRILYAGKDAAGAVTIAYEHECFASKQQLLNYISGNGNENM